MALAIFTRTCAKNVSGASKVFIAEAAVVTAVTVASGEITAITGTTPFMRVDAEQDSVGWNQKEERIGTNNSKISNTIEFDVVPPSTATNTFLQALIDGSPCGLLALVQDGNGKVWLVGYNSTDAKARPLRLNNFDHNTGKGVSDEKGNTVPIQLYNECSGLALPLDATLTAAVVGGTSTIVKWT